MDKKSKKDLILYEFTCFASATAKLGASIIVYVIDTEPIFAQKKALNVLKELGWHYSEGISEAVELGTANPDDVSNKLRFLII